VVKIQVEIFWIVTQCTKRFEGLCCLQLQGEPQHYTASQPRRPQVECLTLLLFKTGHSVLK